MQNVVLDTQARRSECGCMREGDNSRLPCRLELYPLCLRAHALRSIRYSLCACVYLSQACLSFPYGYAMLQGKRANFLIFYLLRNKSIHTLSMTMKSGQGDMVSVYGFVG